MFNVDTTFAFAVLNTTNDKISVWPLTDAVYALPDGCNTLELNVIVDAVEPLNAKVLVVPPFKLLNSITKRLC